MNTEKIVPTLAGMLANDRDEDVRTAAAEAISMFGTQGSSLHLAILLCLISIQNHSRIS